MSQYNFNTIPSSGVYVALWNKKIVHYDKSEIFDLERGSFSNGFGGEWFYRDYGKTWSFEVESLYNVLLGELRPKASYYDNIENLTKIDLPDDIKTKILTAYIKGFYGTMYGGSPKTTNGVHNDILHYTKENGTEIGTDGSLYYVWGWPGPDYTTWSPNEYGVSWALTKEELAHE